MRDVWNTSPRSPPTPPPPTREELKKIKAYLDAVYWNDLKKVYDYLVAVKKQEDLVEADKNSHKLLRLDIQTAMYSLDQTIPSKSVPVFQVGEIRNFPITSQPTKTVPVENETPTRSSVQIPVVGRFFEPAPDILKASKPQGGILKKNYQIQ